MDRGVTTLTKFDAAPHALKRTGYASSGATRLAMAAALAVVYFLTGKLGLRLATIHPSATAVWAPTGISLAACVVLGSWIWPAVLVGAFLVNVTTAGSVATCLGIAVGNTLEALVGAFMVRHFAGGQAVFTRTRYAFKFMILAAALSTMLAATIGVTALCLSALARWSDFGRIWLTWWLGDTAGDLIVAPLLILWSVNPRIKWNHEQLIEIALLLLSLGAIGSLMFGGWPLSQRYPLEFLGLPILLWAAFRFGPREAVTALFILLVMALAGTLHGRGPYAQGTRNEALLFLQTFAGLTSMMIIAVAIEVAQRRALDENRARIAAIVDSSNDAIIGETLAQRIISWNSSAARIFGFSADEAIGQSSTIIVPAERRAEEAQVLAQLRRGEVIRAFETVRQRRDGTPIDVALTVSPVRGNDGQIIGVSKIARDISEEKRIRREREELLRSERAARGAAEAATRAKDEFLAMLGHELRNPLNAISLAMRLLERAGTPAERANATGIIARQTEHVSRLVNDLLDVARVTSGRIVLLRRPMDLAATIAECIDVLRQTRQLDKHRVETALEAVWVEGDADRLAQIATNLINNAMKYTVADGTIQVSVRPAGEYAELRVTDSGIGIAAAILPGIFDLFVRGDHGLGRSPGGLGIGLTLVKRLTELHGGAVEALSEGAARGSTFVVRLPRIPAPEPGPAEADGTLNGAALPRRILIVEDNADSRESLRAWLEMMGHEVHEAADGVRGVELALAVQPDLALVDLGLPGLDGYEVAARIRASANCGATALIAISGYGQQEYRERAMRVGFQEYMVKPVDLRRLRHLIAAAVRGAAVA